MTAFAPTPFRPTDFLKAASSNFPPVLRLLVAFTTESSGMPRPKSLTVTLLFSMLMEICLPKPIANSSMELSTISFSIT